MADVLWGQGPAASMSAHAGSSRQKPRSRSMSVFEGSPCSGGLALRSGTTSPSGACSPCQHPTGAVVFGWQAASTLQLLLMLISPCLRTCVGTTPGTIPSNTTSACWRMLSRCRQTLRKCVRWVDGCPSTDGCTGIQTKICNTCMPLLPTHATAAAHRHFFGVACDLRHNVSSPKLVPLGYLGNASCALHLRYKLLHVSDGMPCMRCFTSTMECG